MSAAFLLQIHMRTFVKKVTYKHNVSFPASVFVKK
ncbi:hypothetical protein B14911_02914 [Bacillus sp. NRRL B-14911]|uniref:Uncharacterized protein n=1 Tax=Bacillus infantis NRRL B-14911 TaxID=1367477 RepID=U5LGK4_9BACI|nr:hypothetical protein N288_23625 [Bacillus infantis NRRL B-14911]EAR68499.1 hypothetical protein B14911_02914 [Bacillus sp. NRRL B-14911]